MVIWFPMVDEVDEPVGPPFEGDVGDVVAGAMQESEMVLGFCGECLSVDWLVVVVVVSETGEVE